MKFYLRTRALWLATALLLSATASGQTIAVRGSLHCCPAGNPAYERPIRNEFAIVVPLEYPQYAVIVAQDGVFDLILPYSRTLIDKVLPIRVHANCGTIGESAVFINGERLVRKTEGWLYEIPEPIVLPSGCEGLMATLESAEVELDRLWREAWKDGTRSRAGGPSRLGSRVSPDDGPADERIVLAGAVLDSAGRPLEGALVSLSGVHFASQTRNDGTFRSPVRGRTIGEEILATISRPDHQTARIRVRVTSHTIDLGTIVLTHQVK